MRVFGKSFKISASAIILGLLVVSVVIALIAYSSADNGKWGDFFGGLSAGLVVAIIQFWIAWQDYAETEKLKRLKLIEVFYNRASRDKYCELIKNCNKELDIMGVTAVRFFNDFSDTSSGAPEDATVLIKALELGVKVRVLLPSKQYLPESKKVDYEKVKSRIEELHKYNNLEVRYFNHTAAHSIFRIDDTCIIGPIFPELESRNTSAMHLKNNSPVALQYMGYFSSEWEQAN